jgi:probable DNA metabolism protein
MRFPDNFLHYLSAHADCNERLLARARDFSALDLEILANADAKRLRKMVLEVQAETYRMKAFVRLKPLGRHVLYGYLKPRHKIADRICDHFARRNPETIIVLGNGQESWISLLCDAKTMREHGAGMTETLERLGSALRDSGEVRDAEGILKTYYDSQYCPERKNLRVFIQRMPRRDQDSAGLHLMQGKNNVTLEDFFAKI